MNFMQLIKRSVEGFNMALSQFKTLLVKSVVSTEGDTGKLEMANRKRLLERELRDSGLSRSEARRITGAVMRQNKPNT